MTMVKCNSIPAIILFVLVTIKLLIDIIVIQKASSTTEVKHTIENHYQLKVLLWNPFWDVIHFTKNVSICEQSNCVLSYHRQNIGSFDAIVFHWPSIDKNDLPSKVLDYQKWVIFTMESPHHIEIGADRLGLEKIDLIMSYRTDSDIPVTYGSAVQCKRDWKPKYKFEDKTKSIVWMVSHCHTYSRREEYTQILAKYIDIDIYGQCGPNYCPRSQTKECNEMISAKYKFYLSFENSICKDYVTEKVFNYMNFEVIPIVLGGANYSSLLPPNSYIDVMDFSSPRLLAQYLKRVANNERLYNSYFEWKKSYCIEVTSLKTNLCKLCQFLRSESNSLLQLRAISSKEQLRNWWVKGSNCSTLIFDNENISLVPQPYAP